MTSTINVGAGQKVGMVVIYDRASGEIVHTHQCVTAPGARHPGKRQLERDARVHGAETLRAAARAGRRVSLLHVDPGKLKLDVFYKVDHKRRVLTKLTRRRRRLSALRRR